MSRLFPTGTLPVFLIVGALCAQAAPVTPAVQPPVTPPVKSPNFLFIFADDQCYETVRAFGHTDIDTPNLDRLAARGMTFTHCYNMGSYSGAVCVASRTMLNTGRFLWHAQRLHRQAEKERQAGRFWSEYLKKACQYFL